MALVLLRGGVHFQAAENVVRFFVLNLSSVGLFLDLSYFSGALSYSRKERGEQATLFYRAEF